MFVFGDTTHVYSASKVTPDEFGFDVVGWYVFESLLERLGLLEKSLGSKRSSQMIM